MNIDFKRLIFSTHRKKLSAPHLQWHLTDRCNLRCSHCYQDGYTEHGLEFDELLEIIEQFKGLILFFRQTVKRKIRGHITITGGEPLVKKELLQLLQVIASQQNWFTFSILTNGVLIGDEWAKTLKKLKAKYVQVSLDGDRTMHDQIRGKGSFEKSLLGIKKLRQENIRVLVSFTATRSNFLQFSSVAEVCRQLDVNFLWSDRLIPEGNSKNQLDQLMSPTETNQFFKLMRHEAEKCKSDKTSVTRVRMHRALQFQYSDESPYRCVAGETLVTIMPNGDLYPCRRMPVKVGNIFEKPLAALYYDSPIMRSLRNKDKVSSGCESCSHNPECRGGLKCLSYSINKNAHVKDPGCLVV